jgi:uncharacterized protein (DUF488 family)
MKKIIYTIGHSNTSQDEFIKKLKAHGIKILVDVRRHPKSRKNPQFDYREIDELLKNNDIYYDWMGELLGGKRDELEIDEAGLGWKNKRFAKYAVHAKSEVFEIGLKMLMSQAKINDHEKVAIMCSEVLPTKCHRRIISDYLLSRGFGVEHIINEKSLKLHEWGQWGAKPTLAENGTVEYRKED